jgi:DNA-binding XRE family transcriptional regulator
MKSLHVNGLLLLILAVPGTVGSLLFANSTAAQMTPYGAQEMPPANVSIKQIKAARELLGWSQEAIAKASGVSIPTIKRLEAAGGDLGGRPATGEKIIAALETAGVEFLDDGQGVRLKPPKAKGKRK